MDSQLFRGTCYKAQGWQLLGATKGFERSRQDYYTEHARPKQLWVRELAPGARGILAAAALPAALQPDALAAGSGCTVYRTKVCVRPNYTVPIESTISKGPDTGNQAPWDKTFPPKKP